MLHVILRLSCSVCTLCKNQANNHTESPRTLNPPPPHLPARLWVSDEGHSGLSELKYSLECVPRQCNAWGYRPINNTQDHRKNEEVNGRGRKLQNHRGPLQTDHSLPSLNPMMPTLWAGGPHWQSGQTDPAGSRAKNHWV